MKFVEKDKILEKIDGNEVSLYLADFDGLYDNDDWWYEGDWYHSDGYADEWRHWMIS